MTMTTSVRADLHVVRISLKALMVDRRYFDAVSWLSLQVLSRRDVAKQLAQSSDLLLASLDDLKAMAVVLCFARLLATLIRLETLARFEALAQLLANVEMAGTWIDSVLVHRSLDSFTVRRQEVQLTETSTRRVSTQFRCISQEAAEVHAIMRLDSANWTSMLMAAHDWSNADTSLPVSGFGCDVRTPC